MSLELDHVFICVEEATAAERALADFGLQFGLRAVHGGQGTANACAFFDNAYLELLSRHDDQELQSPAVRPLALWERVRWRQTGASPFGIAFRTRSIELGDPEVLTITQAPEHHLELDWDCASAGEFHDFHPTLPLVLRW